MVRATPLPPEERRAAIMAATEPLLALHGPNVSTRQIAEAAGVAEGTIFRVFPTKEALIDAVMADALDPDSASEELATIDPTLDLNRRMVLAIEIMQRQMMRVISLFHAIGRSRLPQPDDERAKDFRERSQRNNELLNQAIVSVFTHDGDQLRYSPETVASIIRSLIFATTHPAVSDRLLTDPEAIADIILHGVVGHSTRTHLEEP